MNRGELCRKDCVLVPKVCMSGGKRGGIQQRGERVISRIATALYFFFSSVESVKVHRKRLLLWAMCLRWRACRASEHFLSYLKNRTKNVLSAFRSFGTSALDIKDVLSPMSSPTAAHCVQQ